MNGSPSYLAGLDTSTLPKLYTKGLQYFDELSASLAYSLQFISNPIDIFIWGYLSALHEKIHKPDVILEKVANISSCENSQIITSEDKHYLYITLSKEWKHNVQDYIEWKAEHPKGGPILQKLSSIEESKLSEELLQNLQLEQEFEIERNRKAKEIQQNHDVNCKICLEPLVGGAFTVLDSCSHMFHIPCLSDYVKNAIDSMSLPIKCPDQCRENVIYSDIKQVVPKEYLEKFEELSLKNYVDMHSDEVSWCPTPDCKYVFVKDQNQSEFNCPLCAKHYCLACRVEYHKGQTCQEWRISNNYSKNDKEFEEFVKGQKFKQCSQCKFWVEKNQGCDHMTCRCGYQFHYICGGKYQECECVKKGNIRQPPVLSGRLQNQVLERDSGNRNAIPNLNAGLNRLLPVKTGMVLKSKGHK